MSDWNFIEQKEVFLKKERKCWICLGKLYAKNMVIKRSGVSEGKWAHIYMHIECDKYTHEHFSYYDWDNHMPGDISWAEVVDWINSRR